MGLRLDPGLQSATLSEVSTNERVGEELIDENGVDRSLIRWFLDLSPVDRLAALDEHVRLAELVEQGRESAD